MYCRNCGKEINENASVCIGCGVPLKPVQKESNTLAIVGFVLSFFVSVAGLICSIIGYRKAVSENLDNKGLALAGIIISAINLAGIVLTILLYWSLIIALISGTLVASLPMGMLAIL